VLQIRGTLAKRKDLMARNQETERPGAVRIRWLRIIAGTLSLADIAGVALEDLTYLHAKL